MRSQTPLGEGGEGSEVDGHVVWTKVVSLPTPEEKMRQTAKSVPTDIVAINITGTTRWYPRSSNHFVLLAGFMLNLLLANERSKYGEFDLGVFIPVTLIFYYHFFFCLVFSSRIF